MFAGSWTLKEVHKMFYDDTCVRVLILNITVTSVTSTFVRRVQENIC